MLQTTAKEAVELLPATSGQERLWFLYKLVPNNAAYNNSLRLSLSGDLDVSRLTAALYALVARHTALRTIFSQDEAGRVWQKVLSQLPVDLPLVDVSSANDPTNYAQALLIEAASQPFDPAVTPLFRFTLYRLSPTRHILLLTFCHIVADEVASQLFLQELGQLYQDNELSSISKLGVSEAETEPNEKLAEWWKSELAASFQLDLPTDYPYPPMQSFAGDYFRQEFELDAIKKFATANKVAVYNVVSAAWSLLLSRYSGQLDINLGMQVQPQPRQAASTAPNKGHLTVLRTNFENNPSFAELVSQHAAKLQEIEAQQGLSFSQLIDIVQPERHTRRNPLFQAMLDYRGVETGPDFGALTAEITTPAVWNYAAARYELTLVVTECADKLVFHLNYNTDLYERETIQRFARHYVNLLEAALQNPDLPARSLSFLDSAERHQLLVEWNANSEPFPTEPSLVCLIEQYAASQPAAIALSDKSGSLTYQQLNSQANQLAHFLREQGVTTETGVASCLPRTNQTIVALLAILKAGGFYIPLDPAYPAERSAYILDNAQVRWLISLPDPEVLSPQLAAKTAELNLEVFYLDQLLGTDRLADYPTDNPPLLPTTNPHNLMHVLYTSGSTGKPKGVALEQLGVLALIGWTEQLWSAEEREGVLFATSLCFDLSVYELWCTLALGGRIIVAENALDLLDHPLADQVRLINTVPSAIAELVRAGGVPGSVRVVNLAGEPLSNSLVQKLYSSCPQVERVYNLYGPTEDTTYSTWYLVERGSNQPVRIGQVLPNSQAYVLDEHLNPLPLGVAGELYLGGVSLARGYYRRDDLTAERFVANPYAADYGSARLYKTGDLVRWRWPYSSQEQPDGGTTTRGKGRGELEYLGRLDQQVKLRGFRIELDEIGRVLESLSGVSDSAIVVREDTPGDKQLVGYVVLKAADQDQAARENDDAQIRRLRAGLEAQLAPYMIPNSLLLLDELPRLPNGKLNRHALPAPQTSQISDTAEYVAPQTQLQQKLAKIFAEILGVEKVGLHTNFFEAGGHSLKATRVLLRISEFSGVKLPLRTIFEAPTVAALEKLLLVKQEVASTYSPIIPLKRQTNHLPLSSAQKRLWFIYQLNPHTPVYNIVRTLQLHGNLHLPALERALQEIAQRHEVLRTNFQLVGEQPWQVIHAQGAFPLTLVDLQSYPVAEQTQRANTAVQNEANRPFQLENEPLVRGLLIKLQPTEHLLVLNIHHIIFDGWSFGIFFKELSSLYNAYQSGLTETVLAPPALQYADFSEWQSSEQFYEEQQSQLEFWKKYLQNAPTLLDLPLDKPRPQISSFKGGICEFALSPELGQSLYNLSQRHNATLHMLLLGAFGVLLQRYTGQNDILLGTPFANRERVELENLPGFFANSLVVRVQLPDEITFEQLLGQMRANLFELHNYQSLQFERLVESLQPVRSLGYNPLFQALLVLQNTPDFPASLNGLEVTLREADNECAKLDLLIQLTETPQGLVGHLRYNADIFEQATAERLTANWLNLLERLVAQPEQPVAILPILAEVERRQQLLEWNNTSSDYPAKTVSALFEEQVAATPQAVALVSGKELITYAELNARANRLAHFLQEQGVKNGTPVGFCLERSPLMLEVILAILKAGGSYVPFDANYPQERLSFMLKDTGLPLLIAQRRFAEMLPPETNLLFAEDFAGQLEKYSPENLPTTSNDPNAPAYIMYTSGSTGQPKGVLVPHRGIVRLVKNTNYAHFGAEEVFLQFAPISFDASTLEIWGSLLNGSKLVICPPHALSLNELAGLIEEHKVTFIWLTSGLFHQLVQEHALVLAKVRQVLAGGDVLQPEYVKRLLTLMDGKATLINGYGPTENTTFTTCYPMTNPAQVGATVSIGRPVANTQVYVLDKFRQPVPQGVAGELYIGGAGLALGYLNRPALTDEKFVPNPFSSNPGERLYKTGDLVRYLPDGNIEFLGRLDSQVKIRGFRIELGEIETLLSQHPAVQSVVVTTQPDNSGTKQIVAYVVLENPTLEAKQLRSYLREQLPDYMLPAIFVSLTELPLDPNGKVNRRKLPAPTAANTLQAESETTSLSKPTSAFQLQLAQIWSELLNLPEIYLETNFFEAGGHSLLATQLVSRVRQALQVDISVRDLFAAATLKDFAAIVERSPKLVVASAIKRVARPPRS